MTAEFRATCSCLAAAALPAALLLTAACSTLPPGETTRQVSIQPGVPGAYAIETFKTTATVTAIDTDKRKLSLAGQDGKTRTLKAGPAVANFDQIRVGDKVVVSVAEELLVYMAKEGLKLPDGTAAVVARNQPGDAPGVYVAGVAQTTAKVTGLDRKNRKALLQLPDGTTQTFTVRPDIDLSKYGIGDEVVFRCTEAMAVDVQTP